MKIETKRNIGDFVYIIKNAYTTDHMEAALEVLFLPISEILLTISSDSQSEYYKFENPNNSNSDFTRVTVYDTKESLYNDVIKFKHK